MPPIRARAKMHLERLQLGELFDRKPSQLAPQAALTIAAERQCGVAVHKAVDPDRSGAHTPPDPEGRVDIARPHAGRQAVERVLASCTAAAAVSNVNTESTGPKISSRAICIVGTTPVNTVGCMKRPRSLASRAPPVWSAAPSRWAEST